MALIYQATLRPNKLELLADWLPRQPWYTGRTPADLTAVGAYRFDDPDGRVGSESHVLRTAEGQLLHVPLTYREAPLPGGEARLVGTMEHSVLGQRWVYDGCADPVHVVALAYTVLTGGREADEVVEADGAQVLRRASVSVRGSGAGGVSSPQVRSVEDLDVATDGDSTVVVTTEGLRLVVRHVLALDAPVAGDTLTGTWEGQDRPVLLATVSAG
jgi:hypothetical protein